MDGQKCCQDGQKRLQVAVVMVPLPAQGHLNQLLHFSHLIASYDLPVHFAGSATHNRQAKLRLHGRDPENSSKIHFHDFPLPPFSSPPPNPNSSTHFPAHLQPVFDNTIHLRQPVFQLLRHLASIFRRVIVIHDSGMASVVQDAGSILNAESYIFNPISAFTMFLYIWESLTEKPFELLDSDFPRSIPSNEGCLTPEVAEFIGTQHKLLDPKSGRVFNTCRVIEGKYVELLEKLWTTASTKYFAVGPLNPVKMKTGSEKHRHRCLEWLDKQETGSVIYVSFGSTTTMSDDQIKELASGLEKSGQKFIWVLRNADKGDIFTADDVSKPQVLLEGYEERVKDTGMVVREWAPQLEILAHPSTGGFMSHCGWNSCMESISMGVPIAAWPMHSEQPRNSVLVTDVLRVGIVVRDWAHWAELVTSSMVENAVRRLMVSNEGEEMRKRAAELGEAVRGSVASGGASRLEMDSFIAHITR